MPTPPDDVAAMFDLPPLPEPAQSAEAMRAAAEAELAAELAVALESGGIADDAPDSRTDLRVQVSWPARLRLPDGRALELKVRDISDSGVGLVSDEPIPASTVVDFEMSVPPLDEGGGPALVKGTIRTTYTIVQGAEVRCGGTWVQVPAADRALLNVWTGRQRR